MRALLTAIVGLLVAVAAGTASAVELLEGRVTAGAAPVLQNTGGTVRLEQAQVGATERPTFFVPEPGALLQLGSGLGNVPRLPRGLRGVCNPAKLGHNLASPARSPKRRPSDQRERFAEDVKHLY